MTKRKSATTAAPAAAKTSITKRAPSKAKKAVKAPVVKKTPNKTELAGKLFAKHYGKKERKDIIELFMSQAGLTYAGASSYYGGMQIAAKKAQRESGTGTTSVTA